LIKVFYHWEDLYPTFSSKYPKNWEEYVRLKNAEKPKDPNAQNVKPPSSSSGTQSLDVNAYLSSGTFKTCEAMLLQIPDYN